MAQGRWEIATLVGIPAGGATLDGYCSKCKAVVEMVKPVESMMPNGKPVVSGHCPVHPAMRVHRFGHLVQEVRKAAEQAL